MRDLFKRSVAGIAYVAIIILGTILHPYAFAVVFSILLYITLSEFYTLAGNRNTIVYKIISVIWFLLSFLVASGSIPLEFMSLSFLFIIIIFSAELIGSKSPKLKNISIAILGVIYVTVPFGLTNFLIYPAIESAKSFFPWILMGLFFIIWVYDSMAYVTGSMWGRHKIARTISPAKSWEGFLGGAVFAVTMGIFNAILFPVLELKNWIIIAALAVVFGTLGDFFESALKRNVDVKDSGDLIPGHGGILDRLDSFLFAIPVIFVWLKLTGAI